MSWLGRLARITAHPLQTSNAALKFEHGNDFDWDDLGELVRRTMVIDRHHIAGDCARGFAFLADLTGEERVLAGDQYQRERDLWERLNRTGA